MRKVGLIAAAALVAALPLTIDGAFAQGKPGGTGGIGGGGGAAVGGGGGGMRGGGGGGGGVAIGGGGGPMKGGMPGISPGGGGGPRVGGGWAGRPGGGGGWAGNPGGGTRWAGRPGGYHGGWQHRGHRRYWGPGIGFGTGLALGAFAASPYYYGYGDDPYYYDSYPADDGVIVGETSVAPDDVASCRARYRSYDIRTQTFLGYDGQRHPCP